MSGTNEHCISCGHVFTKEDVITDSILYSPNRTFNVCESCYDYEQKIVIESGTDSHTKITKRYFDNLQSIDTIQLWKNKRNM